LAKGVLAKGIVVIYLSISGGYTFLRRGEVEASHQSLKGEYIFVFFDLLAW
jgi:hypothetical protein